MTVRDHGVGRSGATGSSGSPFAYAAFTVLWIASLVSNIGTWMYNAASGWLMTSLSPDPLIVALVQVAASLPMFLFALPGGALADILDRRRLLLVVEIATTAVSFAFAALVWLGAVTPLSLLVFMFLIGAAGAVTAPTWQAILPQLVPQPALQAAIAANGAGFNLSRAVGPALGGVIAAAAGIAAPFWINAISNLGVIGALAWWRGPAAAARRLPAEPFGSAIGMGLRHALHNPPLRATLVRAAAFFLFASAYWALLPLVTRSRIGGGPVLYGVLLGAVGLGAVIGAFALPRLKASLDANHMVTAGTLGTAAALALFGLAGSFPPALLASLIAGASWITVLSTLNVSTQLAMPEWVRGRGLAIFMTILFGSLSIGSMLWGQLAALAGLPIALYAAAAGAVIAVPVVRRWGLKAGPIDLTPSMHWPAPIVSGDVPVDRGPVLVTIQYKVDIGSRQAFLGAIAKLEDERRRDGAYGWGIFEDTAEPGSFLETFLVRSWLEHLRQHERVTNTDRVLQEAIGAFQLGGPPKVTHLVAARREEAAPTAPD